MLAPLALALRFSGEGEIFFKQHRVGREGRPFTLYKFATMLKNSPNMGAGTLTLKDDPRVLPMGRVLRKTKVNELPQLLNVVLGDMSIIGPRPQTPRCFDAFPERSQKEIMKVRPGLSGIGSIVFRNEEEILVATGNPDKFYDEVIMEYKGRLEEWFVQNHSPLVYFKCIFLTGFVIIKPSQPLIWSFFPRLPTPPRSLIPYIRCDQHNG